MITLEDVKAAQQRITGVALKTPLLQSQYLNERVGASVYLKPENLQHVGAFKFRGAYNRLCQLNQVERDKGVVAFSSGNHAQGIAYAAKLLKMDATIVMPHDAPAIKKQGTEYLGAAIRLYDRHNESREDIALEIATQTGATLVPAFDDLDIMAGQGTVGLELIEQMQESGCTPDFLLSPCGGGGLMAGVATAVKSLSPTTRILGVEPENFDDHRLSKLKGARVKIDGTASTLCDSLMATSPGELTWSVNSENVDEFLTVTEDEVAHAISYAYRYLKLVVEPGGAVALAAILQGKLAIDASEVALILSGGNIDSKSFNACLNQFPNP